MSNIWEIKIVTKTSWYLNILIFVINASQVAIKNTTIKTLAIHNKNNQKIFVIPKEKGRNI